jgi:predicted metal-dependent HD superfamily phosphohydrolase
MIDLHRHWPALLSGHTDLRDRLVEAYDEPHRAYHDTQHLHEVLERINAIDAATDQDIDRDAVLLAAWFHDSVYDSEGDNEERSAVLATRELTDAGAAPALVSEVARLVRVTASHQVSEFDLAGQVLCDADLGILAADAQRYAEYTEGVRREYQHVPEQDFRHARAQILRSLLDAPTLYKTGFAKQHWEVAARDNVTREIEHLEMAP